MSRLFPARLMDYQFDGSVAVAFQALPINRIGGDVPPDATPFVAHAARYPHRDGLGRLKDIRELTPAIPLGLPLESDVLTVSLAFRPAYRYSFEASDLASRMYICGPFALWRP